MDDLEWSEDLLRKMTTDPVARRDLLWLRAKEKDDEESVADLERVDPDLARRMRVFAFIDGALDDRKRREAYGLAYDERWRFHAVCIVVRTS